MTGLEQAASADPSPESGANPAATTMFTSLRTPGFRPLFVGGFLFGTARWGLGFLAAYVANDLTGSPRAVQLTGAAMWLPLLFAGAIAGTLADRANRRRLILAVIGVLAPVALALGLAALNGSLRVWMLYPAMFVLGLAWVVDITARRTLVLDVVGADLIDNAMAVEALSTAVALASGVLVGGAVIDALGVGQAFLLLAALLLLAAIVLSLAPNPPSARSTATPVEGERGLRDAIASPALRSVLGVTVVANLFYFSHTPLVPVFADRLEVSALGAGLLASAGGIGMMVSALVVAAFRPPRGMAYVGGVMLALASVIGLAQASAFPLALAAAFVAAVGFGMFSATQAPSTMTSVGEDLRGRAMGLLSMAIGALPLGMFTLGEVAELVGPTVAVTVYACSGLVLLALWITRRPEVLRAGRTAAEDRPRRSAFPGR